jgi:hypothetical protein
VSRAVPAALLAALSGPVVTPYLAIEILFDSGALRLWTGIGSRTIEGQVYTGSGSLLAFDGIEELADLTAKDVTVTLSGLPGSMIALALAEPFQRRQARILQGEASVADVVEIFSGIVNLMPLRDGVETCAIAVRLDSKLVTLRRPRLRRYTQEMQAARYPGDTFLSFVTGLVTAEIPFGRKTTTGSS